MSCERISIIEATSAWIQDLGRAKASQFGVSANGALDQYSARIANVLVGNKQDWPLIEVVAQNCCFSPSASIMVSVTGASATVTVDGRPAPIWAPFLVRPGESVAIHNIINGVRTYIGIGGRLQARRFLGSVAPDPALGFGRRLATGDQVEFARNEFRADLDSVLRSRVRADFTSPQVLHVVRGPEWPLFGELHESVFQQVLMVHPSSNHVGIRLTCTLPATMAPAELSSRGVAIGAVEVTPAGELVLLHRGRSITAGYPIFCVATTTALSGAGQLRPGDRVRFKLVTLERAVSHYQAQRSMIDSLERSTVRVPW